MSAPPIERVCELNVMLSSPIEIDEALYLVGQNGDIYKFKDAQLKNEYHFGGQPSGMVIDKNARNLFVADMANQAIMAKPMEEKSTGEAPPELVKEYEGMPFLGPNSLVYSSSLHCLYFTDSGPFGETSLENSKGSVFKIDLDAQIITPLALNCLAYPSGLTLSAEEDIIYVCETCANRVLRFVYTNQGIYYSSVFIQLSGRFGPMAIAVSNSDLIYIARYEFKSLTKDGMISIYKSNGNFVENIVVTDGPEINGLIFSKLKPNVLYATENSSQPCCIRIIVPNEEKEEKKGKEMIKDAPYK